MEHHLRDRRVAERCVTLEASTKEVTNDTVCTPPSLRAASWASAPPLRRGLWRALLHAIKAVDAQRLEGDE